MSPKAPAPAARRPRRRAMLLSGSAICGAAAMLAGAACALPVDPGAANTAVSAGGTAPTFANPDSKTLNVGVGAPRTVINWSSFDVGAGEAVNFNGMAASDIVVNKAVPQITISGAVTGGGALWFLSPGGVLVNGGSITAGSVLMSNGALDDAKFLAAADMTGALQAIQSSAALINMGDISPAVTASVTASGDVQLSSTGALAVTGVQGGTVSLSATDALSVGAVQGRTAALTSTAGGVSAASVTVSGTAGATAISISGQGVVSPGALTAAAGAISISGTGIDLAGALSAGDGVTLGGPVTLAAATSITAGGPVSFTDTVDGAFGLAVTTGGKTSFAGEVGAVAPLASLAVGGGGAVALGADRISTTGAISLPAVSVTPSGVVRITAGDALTLGALDAGTGGATDLVLQAGKTMSVASAGTATAFKSLSLAAGTGASVSLAGDIAATGSATFASDLVLSGPGLRTIAAPTLSFQGVSGAGSLAARAATSATFAGAVTTAGLAISGGSASFAEPNDVGVLAADLAGDLVFTNSSDLALGKVGAVSGVTAGNVSLSSSGALTQTADDAITTGTLALSAGSAVTLSGQNAFDALGAVSAAGQTVAIADTRALTVAGPIDAAALSLRGAGITFGDLAAADGLTLDAGAGALKGTRAASANGAVNLTGGSIALSGGAEAGTDITATAATGGASFGALAAGRDATITAAAGTIGVSGATQVGRDYSATAQDFTGSALAPAVAGDITLVDTAGGLSVGPLAAGGDLGVTAQNGGALSIAGLLQAGGDVRLATTGGGDVGLGAGIATGAGRSVDIEATGAVSQTAGAVATGTLKGASVGGFSLGQDNAFDRLGAVTNAGAGGVTVVDVSALAIDGPLASGTAGASITAASISFGALTAAQDLSLTAASGAISGGSVASTAGGLSLKGASIALTGPAQAGGGAFTATATGGGLTLGQVQATGDIALSATAAGGGAIATGALQAGADVALSSTAGDITAASVSAGDDVALRALQGRVSVVGDLESGRAMTGVTASDSSGAADALAAASTFPDFDPAATTAFPLTGHDVDVHARAITVGGAIVAGVQQPGGDDPDLASVLDTTPSDVRLRSDAPAGLAASIATGDVTATRDIQIDAADGFTGGALKAGQDIAVLARGLASHSAGATADSAVAGRHVVMYAVWGPVHVLGGIQAGHAYAQLQPDSTGDTATGAGERLAAYIGYLDLDDASRPFLGTPGEVKIVGRGVSLDGAVAAAGAVRVQSDGAISLGGAATATDGDVQLQAAGSVTTAGLAASGDVAVWAKGGAVTTGALSAGDDAALRAQGAVGVGGSLAAGGGTEAAGAADRLVQAAGATTLAGQSLDLAGATVDLKGASVSVTDATQAAGDVRVQTPGAVELGGVAAGRDILLDAQGPVGAGALSAGRDVGARSAGAGMALSGATAGGEIVLRAAGALTVAGELRTGAAASGPVAQAIYDADRTSLGAAAQTLDLPAHTVDLRAGGAVSVGGAIAAGGDARLQTTGASGAISAGGVTAGRDVLLDGAGVAAGDLAAGRDIAVRGRDGQAMGVGSASAGDDIAVRGSGAFLGGELTAGGGDAAGSADRLVDAEGAMTVAGQAFTLSGGGAIDVRAASVSLGGPAHAAQDIRLQTTGGLAAGDLRAGRDILLDAGGALGAGAMIAGRDIGARALAGGLSMHDGQAGGALVLRASGSIDAGALTAEGPAAGAARLVAGADPMSFGGTFDLGGDVDVKAGGGVSAGGGAAAGDYRLQALGGAVRVSGAASAGRDLLLDGTGVSAGALTAQRDIALSAGGGAIDVGAATAGDDVAARAAGALQAAGPLSAGGGADAAGAADRLIARSGAITLGGQSFDLAGADIDLKTGGGATLAGAARAAGDLRVQATGAAALAKLSAGGDVLVDAGGDLGAGALSAGGDIALRAANGSLALGDAAAGGSLVLRAAGDIRAGGLSAQGGAGSGAAAQLYAADPVSLDGALDFAAGAVDARAGGAIAVSGAVSAAADARLQTASGGVQLGEATAGRDILLDGDSVASGALAAGGDVAVRARSGAVGLASAAAGDDLVVRAGQDVSVAGGLAAGGGADSRGGGDRLLAAGGAISAAADPAASATAFGLAGADIDVQAGGGVSIGGASAAGGDARFETPGALSLAALTAGQEIFARSASLAIGGDWSAPTVRIEATAAPGVVLGDGATAAAGAFGLSGAALGHISANRVQIFAGDTATSARGASLAVGALDVDTAKIRSALELYAGGQAEVTITGALAPTTAGVGATLLRIGASDAMVGDWTPRSIQVIADKGGSIGAGTTVDGASFTGVRAFGTVELNATDGILAGYRTFVDALAAAQAAQVPDLVKSLIAPPRAGGAPLLITAGSLTLRAGRIAQQDTSSGIGANRTGLYVAGGPLQIGLASPRAAGTAAPDYVELYGAIANGATVLTGASAALSSEIHLIDGATPQQSYRLNTCVILQQAACTPNAGMPDLGVGALRTAALQVLDRQDAGAIEDPTVASATNEEIWRDPQ